MSYYLGRRINYSQSSQKKYQKNSEISQSSEQPQINDDESQNSDDQNEYLNKIQSIWKNIKKTKNIKADQNSSKQSESEQQDQTISQKKKKQSKRFIDQQSDLTNYKQNIQILMRKLVAAQQQIQYLQYQLDKQINQKQALHKQMKKLNKKIANSQKDNSNQNSQNRNQHNIHDQRRFIQEKNDKKNIDRLQLKAKALQKQLTEKDSQIQKLISQNEQYLTQIENLNSSKVSTHAKNHQIQFKGSQILQLNQAYKTIQRLVALLKSTDEYKSFANLAEELKTLHFLNNIPKRLKQNVLNVKISNKTKNSVCNCMQVRINQKLLWTPMLCYKKMLEMKLKYGNLSEDCIEEVLFQMNRLYLSKQEIRVMRIKSYYETQILKLKKKTQLTYDQILAKKQIQRLKKQLTNKKKGHKSNTEKKTNILQSQTQEKDNNNKLDQLRAIGQYEDELRLKQKQIKLLQQRIKLFQSQTSTYDKSLYMEGILWIIDKLLEELDMNSESIRDFENKFRKKISTASSPEEWLRSYKELFESIEELNHSLIEKILNIKQTTIKKMNLNG